MGGLGGPGSPFWPLGPGCPGPGGPLPWSGSDGISGVICGENVKFQLLNHLHLEHV